MEKSVYIRQINYQKTHWWFEGRRNLIHSLFKKFLKNNNNLKILDFGCGSGTNINILKKIGKIDAYEKDKKTRDYLSLKYKNISNVKVIKKIKPNVLYDVILAADVIEHIKNDKKTIIFLKNKLKKKGTILITVPAYNFLFSKKDIILKHYRRYSFTSFRKLIQKKFEIQKISFYNFFLFLPISIITIIFKLIKYDYIDKVEKTPHYLINKILITILNFENFLLKFIDFPFGVSILFVGKKK